MSQPSYRFVFARSVRFEEVEGTMRLAVLAAEGLHGEAQVALDAPHCLDSGRRTCTIAAGTRAGRDLARLFEIFVRREFGPSSFCVERLGGKFRRPARRAG